MYRTIVAAAGVPAEDIETDVDGMGEAFFSLVDLGPFQIRARLHF